MSFRNNLLIAHDGTAYDGVAGASGAFDYNGWYRNATNSSRTLGAHDLTGADPKLVAWSADGDCTNDDVTLLAGSPALDRGDPAVLDRDGSRSDLGATGGPEGVRLVDADGDGFPAGRDCDDGDVAVAPGRPELCNGKDDDCDGRVDLPAPATAPLYYRDADGDGHGTAGTTMHACSPPEGWSTLADDCDDGAPTVHPGAPELCDGIDNDCDALVDGADAADLPAWYPDRDGDGHGRAVADPERGCTGAPGTVALGDDCDDGSAAIAPGMPEHCDGVDEDCDGEVDDDPVSALTFHKDGDGDGWGDADGRTRQACRVPSGFAIMVGDCDDADPDVHPLAAEPCDPPRDMNCDGALGRDDHDSDGFPACEDCDDFDSSRKPGAEDPWYDGRIQDCTRTSDYDQDGDGFDAATAGGDDCDDTSVSIHPGQTDVAGDAIDADCDGVDGSAPGTGDDEDTDPGDDGKDDARVACDGCSGAGGPSGAAPLLLLGLLARRRRRG
jgi:MYXO-CTERM domain-containing protein